MVNDRGGINGRKINLVTYDDAYSPPKTAEQTRKLVESDVVSGVTKFANFAEFPMTTTGLPSYNTEGRIYAK